MNDVGEFVVHAYEKVYMLKRIFSKKQIGTGISESVLHWPPDVSISDSYIPDFLNKRVEEDPNESLLYGNPASSFKPALIITLGETGAILSKELTQQPGILLNINSGIIQIGCVLPDKDSIELDPSIHTFTVRHLPHQSLRKGFADGFEVSAFNHVLAWISDFAQRNQGPARVYLVASVYDPLVGILPRLLQLIKLHKGFSTSFAFLVADSPSRDTRLTDADAAATLRELARFLYKDNHVLTHMPGIPDSSINQEQELLNHLFVLGPDFEGAKNGDYEDTLGQALWESIYSLVHPSGEEIHQRLSNYLTHTAVYTRDGGSPLISGCSIASVRAPLFELQEYVAARMASDILFHEEYGLLDRARRIAWQINLADKHPFFKWTLDSNKNKHFPSSFEINNVDNFQTVFRCILSDSLNRFLESGGTLREIKNGIESVGKNIENSKTLLQQSQYSKYDLQRVLALLREMQADVNKIGKAVDLWGRSIFGSAFQHSTATRDVNLTNPFDTLQKSRATEISLQSIARDAESNALDWLKKNSQRFYSYSVLNVQNPQQVEEFYNLVSTGSDIQETADKIKRRFGWWAQWDKAEFSLSLIFLPDRWHPELARMAGLHNPEQIREIYEKIRKQTKIKSSDIRSHFTNDYFDMLMAVNRENLNDADQLPYLNFDLKTALMHQRIPGCRLGFVIGRDESQLTKIRSNGFRVFKHLASSDVISISGNENTRITAFGLNTYIPLTSLSTFKSGIRNAQYICPQETIAREYEKIIEANPREYKKFAGERNLEFIFSPNIVSTMWNQSLVRVFFRLFFFDQIYLDQTHVSNLGVEFPGKWQIKAISQYECYPLSDGGDIADLFQAYQNFVVRFLINPSRFPVKTSDSSNPFSYKNRIIYLNLLRDKCRLMRQSNSAINNEFLDGIQMRLSMSDKSLYREFGLLMQIERKNVSQVVEEFSEPLFN